MDDVRGAEVIRDAYSGRRVLVTGHTGFKGGWLTIWLNRLGARVTGFALAPEEKSVFLAAHVASECQHREGDVRDFSKVAAAIADVRPHIIFHLAAQSLVRRSYAEPLTTIETNINGTAHVLEAVRRLGHPCAVVVVSSDKCYENQEWLYGYRENEPLGGHDPYSMSKGATELVTNAWRRSYFAPELLSRHGVPVASVRAGNVIGGGDWAEDRIVPDAVRALSKQQPVEVRNPRAIRPWQHVLEPLSGYLLLGARLLGAGGVEPAAYCQAWNFGPLSSSTRQVSELVGSVVSAWGEGSWVDRSAAEPGAPHEAQLLRLSIEKAQVRLGWQPRWTFEQAVSATVEWYRAQLRGQTPAQLKALTAEQIARYEGA